MDSMRELAIHSKIVMLTASLRGVRKPVDTTYPEVLFGARKYTEMYAWVRRSMGLDIRLFVKYTERAGLNGAPAWVETPAGMPLYGTAGFRSFSFRTYIWRKYLETASAQMVIRTIAHELSHIVLAGLCHPLQKDEPSVDLTLMILGFRDVLMEAGAHSFWTSGYLTAEEASFARGLLLRQESR